jgi:pimeloyl-ACP methyl ester carboxylesterase
VGIGLALTSFVTLALTAACTVGPSQRPSLVIEGAQPSTTTSATAAPGKEALPPLEKPSNASIDWSDCTGQTRARLGTPAPPGSLTFQCARVVGPLDPTQPDGGIARLALLKVGTGPTPLVVVNDLTGLPGSLYAARLAAQLPASFLKTYSLIGLDRRGTGGSDGVHCVPQVDRDEIVGYDPARTNLNDLLSASLDASQQCVLALDNRASSLDTVHTVADLDLLRQELGLTRLNAIGHGEGSRVLTVYADKYPAQVGRFVLDGSPDPSLSSTDSAQAGAAAAEATFNAFATQCVNAGNCPLGSDPRTALTQLIAQLRTQSLTTSDGYQLTPGSALQAVLTGLASQASWPGLATAIAQARTGDGTGLEALVSPISDSSQYDPARLDADLVSGCNDEQGRPAPGQVSSLVTAWGAKQPLFGALYAQGLLWCAPWPVPEQPLPAPNAPGTPPILVLSTANDPVTPAAGSQRTAADLANGVLVSWQGSGHGALGQSSCATTAATKFLINGQVPQNFTSCPA